MRQLIGINIIAEITCTILYYLMWPTQNIDVEKFHLTGMKSSVGSKTRYKCVSVDTIINILFGLKLKRDRLCTTRWPHNWRVNYLAIVKPADQLAILFAKTNSNRRKLYDYRSIILAWTCCAKFRSKLFEEKQYRQQFLLRSSIPRGKNVETPQKKMVRAWKHDLFEDFQMAKYSTA